MPDRDADAIGRARAVRMERARFRAAKRSARPEAAAAHRGSGAVVGVIRRNGERGAIFLEGRRSGARALGPHHVPAGTYGRNPGLMRRSEMARRSTVSSKVPLFQFRLRNGMSIGPVALRRIWSTASGSSE